jgi:hypothetical protein
VIDVDGEPYRRHRRFASGAGSVLTVASAVSPRAQQLAAGRDLSLACDAARTPAGSALTPMPAGPQTPATG